MMMVFIIIIIIQHTYAERGRTRYPYSYLCTTEEVGRWFRSGSGLIKCV